MGGRDALTQRKHRVCAVARQRAFKRKVLNGVSRAGSISGAAVTYFTQPSSEL